MPCRPILLVLAMLLACQACGAEVFNSNVASAEEAPEYRESGRFSASIVVRNIHNRAVRVERLDTTCSCSKLELASRFLLPGETTTLAVESANLRRSGPQAVRVSLFLTDPDLDPIEVWCWWKVKEAVSVDAVPPGMPALERPADQAWRDIYRFVAHERPDEPQRLKKRIRLACPPDEAPPGGLRIEGIDYKGTLWEFSPRTLENGAIVITATARDQQGPIPEGNHQETVVIRTNHPDKARIELRFEALIDTKAGREVKDMMRE